MEKLDPSVAQQVAQGQSLSKSSERALSLDRYALYAAGFRSGIESLDNRAEFEHCCS